jgi:hypothetical protein
VISLSDSIMGVSVSIGEKVTIRIEEQLKHGLIWSAPGIDGQGLTLTGTRSIKPDANDAEYREFVFTTHQAGRNFVTASLNQSGLSRSVKEFFMIVDVLEPGDCSGDERLPTVRACS